MKKYILSLVAMTIIGTGTISAQRMDCGSNRGNRMEMRGDRGSRHDMRGGYVADIHMRGDFGGPRGVRSCRGPREVYVAPAPCPAPVVYVEPVPAPCPVPPPAPVVVGGHCGRTAAAVAVGAVAAVTLASLLAH